MKKPHIWYSGKFKRYFVGPHKGFATCVYKSIPEMSRDWDEASRWMEKQGRISGDSIKVSLP